MKFVVGRWGLGKYEKQWSNYYLAKTGASPFETFKEDADLKIHQKKAITQYYGYELFFYEMNEETGVVTLLDSASEYNIKGQPTILNKDMPDKYQQPVPKPKNKLASKLVNYDLAWAEIQQQALELQDGLVPAPQKQNNW